MCLHQTNLKRFDLLNNVLWEQELNPGHLAPEMTLLTSKPSPRPSKQAQYNYEKISMMSDQGAQQPTLMHIS